VRDWWNNPAIGDTEKAEAFLDVLLSDDDPTQLEGNP
jgi:hypothetical protein